MSQKKKTKKTTSSKLDGVSKEPPKRRQTGVLNKLEEMEYLGERAAREEEEDEPDMIPYRGSIIDAMSAKYPQKKK